MKELLPSHVSVSEICKYIFGLSGCILSISFTNVNITSVEKNLVKYIERI